MHRPHRYFVALGVAGAITLAACGSSSGSHAAAVRADGNITASTVATGSAHVATPTSSGGAPHAEDASSVFCNGAGPGGALQALAVSAGAPIDAAKYRRDLEQFAKNAPSELEPDAQTIVGVVEPILDGKVAQDQIERRLADPTLQTAMEHIATWSAAHCRH